MKKKISPAYLSFRPNANGFTLIELLIVITILGVLATAVLLAINPLAQFAKARDARRKSELKQIHDALQRYYVLNGQYPPAGICAYGTNCYVFSTAGPNWIPALITSSELKIVPVDPINHLGSSGPWDQGNYAYAYGNVAADGSTYDLFTQLENTSDPDRCGVKDYTYLGAIQNPPWHWCTAFGGAYSNQIYAIYP
jgi:prepilin-type N-terminal cleavage/methylation domain-containing protein